MAHRVWRVLLALSFALLLAACGGDAATTAGTSDDETADPASGSDDDADEGAEADAEGPLTVYSGRSEELVGPLLERFTEATGIELEVRYGDTAELAATILEEGGNSPADVYFGQDAGALGALADEEVLRPLPDAALEQVEDRFRSDDGTWVGVSGRARVLVHSTESVDDGELPDTVLDLTDERWRDRIGWAPTNGSFQAFVTAMRVELGEEQTEQWLRGMQENGARAYEGNSAIVEAAARGEIEVGLVNHYYLYQFLAENPDAPVANHFFDGGDVGLLVNVAGTGILESTDQPGGAEELVSYLLGDEAQRYFVEETYEYPLVEGIEADERLPALADIDTPDLDLGSLEDLQGTLELLRQTGTLS